MKIWYILLIVALISPLLSSCEDAGEGVDNTATPTVTFSEDDLVYEVKVNKTITIEPTLTNVIDGSYSWSYNSEIISRESKVEFSSSQVGQHFITFTLDANNGTLTRELRIDVLELTTPVVTLPVIDGMVRAVINCDTEIIPTLKYCDNQTTYRWYIDEQEVGNTSSIVVNMSEIGEFSLRLDVENSDGYTRAEERLCISETPYLSLEFDQDIYYVACGGGIVLSPYASYADEATSYSWSVASSSQTSSTKYLAFTPEAIGDYEVTVSGSNSGNITTAQCMVKCVENIDYQRAITAESSNSVRVYEFTAAPGQFVNYGYTAATATEAATYASTRFEATSYLSLGAWGGYVVVGFDHSVLNVEGSCDIWIGGNATSTSNEPAIVWVMQDVNGDGLPNDVWYELKGSEYDQEDTIQDYIITYYTAEAGEGVRWSDNCGNTGTVDANGFYSQKYYPEWITEASYRLRGTKIKSRTEDLSSDGSEYWSNSVFEWGYVDNIGSDYINLGTEIEIDNAINRDGTAANLKYIDFVKVQTAVNAKAGSLGENSSEITGFKNLNL